MRSRSSPSCDNWVSFSFVNLGCSHKYGNDEFSYPGFTVKLILTTVTAPFSVSSKQWQLEAIKVTRLNDDRRMVETIYGILYMWLAISGAMPCPWTLATVLGSCCMVALVRWFLWLTFLRSPVARGSCRAHYTRSSNENMSSFLLIMFVWIHFQGLIGKFGQVPLSDICAYVELPDGKVRDCIHF